MKIESLIRPNEFYALKREKELNNRNFTTEKIYNKIITGIAGSNCYNLLGFLLTDGVYLNIMNNDEICYGGKNVNLKLKALPLDERIYKYGVTYSLIVTVETTDDIIEYYNIGYIDIDNNQIILFDIDNNTLESIKIRNNMEHHKLNNYITLIYNDIIKNVKNILSMFNIKFEIKLFRNHYIKEFIDYTSINNFKPDVDWFNYFNRFMLSIFIEEFLCKESIEVILINLF